MTDGHKDGHNTGGVVMEMRLVVEIDKILPPLPTGDGWAAKVTGATDGDGQPLRFQIKESWGSTPAEAAGKAVNNALEQIAK